MTERGQQSRHGPCNQKDAGHDRATRGEEGAQAAQRCKLKSKPTPSGSRTQDVEDRLFDEILRALGSPTLERGH